MTTPSPNTTNITDLLLQTLANLPAPPQPPTHTDPTLNLPAVKPALLTLHALYPTLLLPALDVLDRRLITRLDLPPPAPSSSPPSAASRSIYHVRSAAPPRRSHRPGREPVDTIHSYEVRTTAWSCTCAAFAFAAFNQPPRGHNADPFGGEDEMMMDGGGCAGDSNTAETEGEGGGDKEVDCKRWGGLMRVYDERGDGGEALPVCKHLLACTVAECWDGAARMVEVRGVGRGEMAGWAGGWGG